MNGPVRIALVQTTTGLDSEKSGEINAALIAEAAKGGAHFVLFPEVCNMIDPDRRRLRTKIKYQDEDPCLLAMRDAADAAHVWVLAGSVVVDAGDGSGKLANRSVLIDAFGDVRATYDKMHLFDVDVGTDDVYRESDTYRHGDHLTLVETPWGLLGMTVCYDLRFPHVYRDLAKAGAVMLTIPSAFTRPTGEAHWEVLLRARAIEAGAFVLAPAQTGEHEGGRKTYGHSIAVGPWGEVLADAGGEPGITYVEIDPAAAEKARDMIPALHHDRTYTH